MSNHVDSLVGEILYMQNKMGDDADLDFSDNIDDYHDYLYELSTSELYDVYSSVQSRYNRWRKEKNGFVKST